MSSLQRHQHYSFAEFYQALVLGFRSVNAFSRQVLTRRAPPLDPQFVERLMLAVTEVNGCAVCSYAHTRMALREGIARRRSSCLHQR